MQNVCKHVFGESIEKYFARSPVNFYIYSKLDFLASVSTFATSKSGVYFKNTTIPNCIIISLILVCNSVMRSILNSCSCSSQFEFLSECAGYMFPHILQPCNSKLVYFCRQNCGCKM